MSRFRRVVFMITAACHVPFAVAAFELTRRLGAPLPLAVITGIGAALLALYLFLGRAEALAEDAPRPFREVVLIDLPYYVHW